MDGRCIARYNNRSPAGEVLQRRALRGGPQGVNNARSQGAGHLYTTLVTQEPEGFRSQGYLIRIRLEKSVKEGLWQIFGKTAPRGSKDGRLRKRSTDHKNREISKKFVSFLPPTHPMRKLDSQMSQGGRVVAPPLRLKGRSPFFAVVEVGTFLEPRFRRGLGSPNHGQKGIKNHT